VTVNGTVARIGESADPDRDEIRVDGRALPRRAKPVWVVLHKPTGVIVSDRPQGARPTARSLVDLPERLMAVGRLDVESEGVVVLTNDGDQAQRLSHPRYQHEKEYRVLLDRPPDGAQLEAWRRGIVLADGHRTRPAQLAREGQGKSSRWIRLTLREGHKRQIRETARALGLHVERLIRVRLGPFRLGTLRSGEWRMGTPKELEALNRSLPESDRSRSPDRRPPRPHKEHV
jgi:23S rRNA pseudouridine2605 synthase